jgi:hypothetical protein
MIHKLLAAINEADLVALIRDEIPEGRSIEYKRDLPADTREAKAEFLTDVASFANTSGGDLIFGFEEYAGVPTALPGVEAKDPDGLGLRFENMCRDNIEPRIQGLQVRVIPLVSGRHAVLVRIGQSWQAPHRSRQAGVFPARNSRGKYPMDVSELRAAFLNSSSVETRVRAFRAERVKLIASGVLPKPLAEGIRTCMHLVPIESMFAERRLDLNSRHEILFEFRPMGHFSGMSTSVNIDGAIAYTGSETAYTQLFRSGQVEGVFVYPNVPDHPKALWAEFETHVRTAAATYLDKLRQLEFVGPVAVMLTILGSTGSYLHIGTMSRLNAQGLSADIILTPDVVVQEDGQLNDRLTELFEIIWNAYGKVRPKDFRPS